MELSLLKKALERIGQNIGGDWLLLGGSLVRLTADQDRGTEDLDIVRIDLEEGPKERTQLISEMKKLSLSPEQVNSAVYFYLKQIADWKSEIILLQSFANGKIFRPSVTLFAYLKLLRGTPIDQQDVFKYQSVFSQELFNQEKFNSWASEATQQRARGWGLI